VCVLLSELTAANVHILGIALQNLRHGCEYSVFECETPSLAMREEHALSEDR
jgi:hypothetical protein